jgi:hypothetical protein
LTDPLKFGRPIDRAMEPQPSIPVGRLSGVSRNWEFRSGWVRAPLREIVFNDRLSKQARLLWLWLASVPEGSPASWGECETMLRCGTKARRSCMLQLATEGYIDVLADGTVLLNDPYEVFNNKRKEILEDLREEWVQEIEFIDAIEESTSSYQQIKLEKKIDNEIVEIKQPKPKSNAKPKASGSSQKEGVIEAWNKCKPESYSGMRTISSKQQECIDKHMKNLGLAKDNTEDFICSVCLGLNRSEFWSKTVDSSGRNFNSVFGYGNPQDIKMRNIENLYNLGKDEYTEPSKPKVRTLTQDEQDLVDGFRFIRLNLSNYKSRGDQAETQRYEELLRTTLDEMAELNLNPQDY